MSRSITAKSCSSAPAARPTPTRSGWRAANHAVSSAINAAGRNVAITGQAAAQPRGMASSRKPASWSGFGRYPANPP